MFFSNAQPLKKKKKYKFESFLVKWMKLEPVLQSEVSQKEENKYSILTHVYGIYKNRTDEHICWEGRRGNYREQSMDPVGEGESGMNGESSINIYILHV